MSEQRCVCLERCPFFNDRMKDSEGLGRIYKSRYCLGDYTACARYIVFLKLGRERVPPDLYPNMNDRASAVLAEAGGGTVQG
jgi:hypothetical protein